MHTTILDSLLEHARTSPDTIACRFLNEGVGENADLAQELTYRQLWNNASIVAATLRAGTAPGSRVMLFFPPGLAYVCAYYGCLLAGMTAVPLYPPRRNAKYDRIISVARSSGATLALTTQADLDNMRRAWTEQTAGMDGLPPLTFATMAYLDGPDAPLVRPDLDPASPAFLQYTSGSTGTPKGVIVTHANALANVILIATTAAFTPDDVFVNWLPLFHDLGLVTAVMVPLYLGATSTLMAPATFVRDPAAWLRAITRYRATVCGSPNFGYDLCADKISDADLAQFDLRSVRNAYSAAEPIMPGTIARFVQRFAPCGFNPNAVYPAYGMSEAVAMISGSETGKGPTLLNIDRAAFAANRVQLADAADNSTVTVVGCGKVGAPHELRVVSPETRQTLRDGEIGELWFAGPSLSPGYWQLDELTAASFRQAPLDEPDRPRFFRTGDLGFVIDGNVFVTGRMKDLIILNGKNFYPQDIETTACEAHDAIRRGRVIAFSVPGERGEVLVVVAEVERERARSLDADAVCKALREAVALEHEAAVDHVVLIKPLTLPVTTSGKVQRRQTKALFLDGQLATLGVSSARSSARTIVAPRTPYEQLLAAIWARMLGQESVSVTDNFFEIGGTSLEAVQISAEIGKAFSGVELDTGTLIDHPTIESLATHLAAHARVNAQYAEGLGMSTAETAAASIPTTATTMRTVRL